MKLVLFVLVFTQYLYSDESFNTQAGGDFNIYLKEYLIKSEELDISMLKELIFHHKNENPCNYSTPDWKRNYNCIKLKQYFSKLNTKILNSESKTIESSQTCDEYASNITDINKIKNLNLNLSDVCYRQIVNRNRELEYIVEHQ